MVKLSKLTSNLKKLYRHTDNILNMKENPRPISLVIDLTGKCNLNCEFCYIKNRDKTVELDYDKLIRFIDVIKPMSVELTGGEPTLYSNIDKLIVYLYKQKIKIGMFSNGNQLWRCGKLGFLAWLRISINHFIDNKRVFIDPPKPYKLGYSYIVHENSPNDWAGKVSEFANTHRGDYVKLSSDINRQTNILPWGLTTMKAIIQKPVDIKHYKGKCYMGFLKPYVNADGLVYACVGTIKDFDRDKSKSITHIDHPQDLLTYHLIGDQEFDCDNCRFTDRNKFIGFILKDKVEDEEFI